MHGVAGDGRHRVKHQSGLAARCRFGGCSLDSIPTRTVGITAARTSSPEDLTLTQRIAFHGTGALAFSTKGEYGVRLMVQLARHFGSGPASLSAIATDEDLPRAYLEQLAMSLRDAGLVISTRGARGGYELARPAADIHMGEVLRALEGPIAPMICATEDPEHALLCDRSAKCTVNVLWVRVRDAITGTLDAMTLADLAPSQFVHLEAADVPALDPIPTPTLQGASS